MNTDTPVAVDPAGFTPLSVPARDVKPGDLLPLFGAWHTVTETALDETALPALAHITAHGPHGERARWVLADEMQALLRPVPAGPGPTASSNASAAGWDGPR